MKDVTPESFLCHTDDCCPAVFETEQNSYVIIGKKLDIESQKLVSDRVADDEFVIEVPKGMIDMLIAQQ